MLFFIILIAFIVGIVCWVIYERPSTSPGSPLFGVGLSLTILSAPAAILSIFFLSSCYFMAEATLDGLEVKRASLVYQYENDFYDNDNDIGKKELMTAIQDFNTSLAKNKRLQCNPWVGIYVPNIYDDLELIDISQSGES